VAGPKEQRWFWSAEELYVQEGLCYEAIARRIPVSKATLSAWAQKGGWAEKRRRWLATREGLSRELRRQLERTARRLISEEGELSDESLKRLERLQRLIQGFEVRGPDMRTMAVEVMGRFAAWLRDQTLSEEDLIILRRAIDGFLGHVEALT